MIRKIRNFFTTPHGECDTRKIGGISLMISVVVAAALIFSSLCYAKITDGVLDITYITTNSNADSILASAGIKPNDQDIITQVRDGNTVDISLDRAFAVTVTCGNSIKTIWTQETTVGSIVAMAGIALSEYDLVSPAVDTMVTKPMFVDVVNIEYTTTSTHEYIPYTTKTVKSASLLAGTKTVTAGSDGIRTITYKNKVIDGVIVESYCVGESVLKEPVDEIITIGTGSSTPGNPNGWISTLTPKNEILLDENGIPINYVEKLTGTATAYHGDPETSTGVTPQPGYIAVNPKVIPYGTKMFIRSTDGKFIYGYAVAADTGGACMKNKIIADLYFPTEESMHEFGRRGIEIYILE